MTRREQILAIAAELFAARGFHGVSVSEIGAACGISGPALYKHFPAKDAVLAAMLVGISEDLLSEGRRRVEASDDARDALHALIAWHIDFAINHPALIVVQERDWQSLPAEARDKVRTLQREYVDLWADQLRALDGDLPQRRARSVAHANFGLLNSTPHSSLVPADEMRGLLEEMSRRCLGIN